VCSSDLLYGPNVVYIIPQGTFGRLPWVNEFDLHASIDVRLGRDMVLSIGADCFNVLGSEQVTAVDQSWVFPTSIAVRPIPNGSVSDLQHNPLYSPSGAIIPTSNYNANFGHATAYQPPRNFRFLARVTF
jgi:hypothetical protein